MCRIEEIQTAITDARQAQSAYDEAITNLINNLKTSEELGSQVDGSSALLEVLDERLQAVMEATRFLRVLRRSTFVKILYHGAICDVPIEPVWYKRGKQLVCSSGKNNFWTFYLTPEEYYSICYNGTPMEDVEVYYNESRQLPKQAKLKL